MAITEPRLQSAFDQWMQEPAIKAAIAAIPPSPHGLLVTVLESAFLAGATAGGRVILNEMGNGDVP